MRKTACFLAFAAFLLPQTARSAPAAGTILVAQAADLSGPNADFGRDHMLGAKVYFDYINANGGIDGNRIAYRIQDSGGVATRSVAAAQSFIKEGASVLFGFTGDDSVAAVAGDKTVRNARVPLFAPVAGNTSMGASDGVFYLRASIAREIQTAVAHLASMGIRTFAIASATEHGQADIRALDEEAARQGASVLTRSRLDTSGDGPADSAQAIARLRPQAVIVVADTLAVAQFFQRYRQLDPGAFLCAPSLVNVRTLTTAMGPKAARGIIVSQVVPDPGAAAEVSREHKKLMERYADEPASQATLEGFIAAKALVRTLRRNRSGASGLAQALRNEGRVDLGGFTVNYGGSDRASDFVELTVVSQDGRLLR